jgi:hypothetical protein
MTNQDDTLLNSIDIPNSPTPTGILNTIPETETKNETKAENKLLYESHLKCPNCNRSTDGEKDYYSLVEGSKKIKKTCTKCRKDVYASYKKKHPTKIKITKNETNIDYNTEYIEYKRCRSCNRETRGIEDFKNIRSEKITKTCIICRKSVYASLKKKPRPKPINKITMRKSIDLYVRLLKGFGKEQIAEKIDEIGDTELKQLLKLF